MNRIKFHFNASDDELKIIIIDPVTGEDFTETGNTALELYKMCQNNEQENIIKYMDKINKIRNPVFDLTDFITNDIKLINGKFYYNDILFDNYITKRIMQIWTNEKTMEVEPVTYKKYILFLKNLLSNPSFRAVEELLPFLEFGQMPITDDGCFLGYKIVKNDYYSIMTGTDGIKYRNMIGDSPRMPRNLVNEDKNQTCSSGLHVCSYNYLPHYGYTSDRRVMIVKVNPADVVSIPTDYNNTKLRCSGYTVVEEMPEKEVNDILRDRSNTETILYPPIDKLDIEINKSKFLSMINDKLEWPTQIKIIFIPDLPMNISDDFNNITGRYYSIYISDKCDACDEEETYNTCIDCNRIADIYYDNKYNNRINLSDSYDNLDTSNMKDHIVKMKRLNCNVLINIINDQYNDVCLRIIDPKSNNNEITEHIVTLINNMY